MHQPWAPFQTLTKHWEKHQDLRNLCFCQSPGHSQPKRVSYAEFTLNSGHWPVHVMCIFVHPTFRYYKGDITLPSHTPNTRTQSFMFLWAMGQQEGQYCFRAGDKASFSEVGRSWCHRGSGWKIGHYCHKTYTVILLWGFSEVIIIIGLK